MKKFLLMLAIIGMTFTLTACNDQKTPPKADYTEDPKTTANTTADIIAEKEVDGIKFSAVSVIRDENLSRVSVQAMNTTNSTIAVKSIQIIYKDENGNVLTTIENNDFSEGLAAGGVKVLTGSVDVNLMRAKTVEYKVVQ